MIMPYSTRKDYDQNAQVPEIYLEVLKRKVQPVLIVGGNGAAHGVGKPQEKQEREKNDGR
jgi:hypothetical protein